MWIIFALLNPISESIRGLIVKKTSKQLDPLVMAWANNILPSLIFPIVMIIAGTQIKSNLMFWYGFSCAGVIQIIASILFMKSISHGDLSMVVPILSFTPLFLLVFGPLINGEFPNTTGLLGILLVVIGSYLLNFNLKKMDMLEPFKAIVKNKGTRYMFIVAVLWAISGAFDKISVANSSVLQHVTFTNILVLTAITITLIVQKKFNFSEIKESRKNLLLISGFTSASYFFHYSALALTLVAYVVAMKRLAGLFSVFLGALVLKEENLKQRLLGASVMFAGVLLIVLA